ncbi:hypothetical protein Gotur_014332 [Gossypium turneri]
MLDWRVIGASLALDIS